MTSQGSSYTIFRRALQRGSLTAVRAAVANLPGPPPLDDALVICLLLLDQEPDRYERAAVRWLGRLLLEHRGIGLRHAELAAAYLARLAPTRPAVMRPPRPSASSVTRSGYGDWALASPARRLSAAETTGPGRTLPAGMPRIRASSVGAVRRETPERLSPYQA